MKWPPFFASLLLCSLLVACGDEPDATHRPDVGPTDDVGADAEELAGELVIPAALELDGELEQSASQTFLVENAGEGPLSVTLDPRQSWLSLSETQLDLEALASSELTLSAACREIDEVRVGELSVSSDDPARASDMITVTLICGEAVAQANLTVVLSGLPEGLEGEVSISGPDDFSETITTTTDFEDVVPGTYIVDAVPVTDLGSDAVLWAAAPPSQEVSVALGQEASAVVQYARVPGSLEVSVAGLPTGAQAPLDLVDDDGQTTRLPPNARIDALDPGDYTLIPRDVSAGGSLYSASTQTLSVASEQTTSLTVTYEVGLGSIALSVEGLDGLAPEILVSGPQDYSQTLSGSETLTGLEPGEYTFTGYDVLEGPARYRAEAAVVDVVAGQQANATLSYEVMGGELQIAATGLGGESFSVRVEGPSGTLNELGPVTLSDLIPGDYTLTFIDRTIAGETLRATPAEVSVTVTSDGPAAQAQTTYAPDTATLLLNIDAPIGARLDIEIRENAQVVESFSTVGSVQRELNLTPGTYTVALLQTPTDAFGNALSVTGDGAEITLAIGDETTLEISADSPLVVTSGADFGPGSLREVVNNAAPGSLITFADNVSQVNLIDAIPLVADIRIAGPGAADELIITGAGDHRLVFVAEGVDARFYNLTLSGGAADLGGAISGRGDITLQDVDLRNNSATLRGGAINLSYGRVALRRVRAVGNSSLIDGGALNLESRNIVIEDCLFENNTSDGLGGAIVAYVNGWDGDIGLDVKRSLFISNSAWRGGAIAVSSKGRIENNTFHANQSSELGGALYQESYYGTDGRSLDVAFNTFTDNTALSGSAIWKHQSSPMELRANLIAENPGFAFFTPFGATTVKAVSLGHNVIGRIDPNAIQAQPTDVLSNVEIPSGADPLADNGGFTHTRALQTSVDALLRVSSAQCLGADGQPLYEDQRGAPRPVGAFCSAGAWEDSAAPSANVEGFEGSGLDAAAYTSGAFVGRSGALFTHVNARTEVSFPIDGAGIMLFAGGSLFVELEGPLDALSIDYRKAFTSGSARQVEIFVNGQSRALSPDFGTVSGIDDTVHSLSASALGVSGTATIEIRVGGGQVVLDNLVWE